MNSHDSVKMNNNSKSRIPVSVKRQKFSNVCNDKKNLQTNNCLLKKLPPDTNKETKMCIMQEKIEKKTSLHPEKLIQLKDSNIKNPDFKKKQLSLETSTECASISTKNKTYENNIKSDNKNKLSSCRANIKLNTANTRMTKLSNININSNHKKLPPFPKTKTKSCFNKNLVEDKKENFPSPKSCSFEVEACTPKRNQTTSKDDPFSAPESVEFEANELYRKMILSNMELSPSIRNLMPNLRLSSLQSQRPSVYQKLQIPEDPLKEALKALENTCLSVNRVKKENKVKVAQSPRRDAFRDSIYTPRGNPNEEFLKRLEDYKLKQMQKTAPRSNRKVTFNLNVQEIVPKNSDMQENSFKNTQQPLMQINEKSEENTPKSPHKEKNNEIKLSDISLVHVHNDKSRQIIKTDDFITKINVFNSTEIKAADQTDSPSKCNHTTIEPIMFDKSTVKNGEISLQILKKISSHNSSSGIICDSKKNEEYANCLEDNSVQLFEQKKLKQSAKIYTPKPISLSSKCKLDQSYSPEFLVGGKATAIANLAPICTPLVLKSQAKNMFSPEAEEGLIPLKLDFAEEEKDSPKKEIYKNHTLFPLDNIVTFQKQLDDLADQECCLSLMNENFPVICGRYLTNPIATTLNEGDDMHFIPVQL